MCGVIDKRIAATFSKAEHTVINVGDSESPRLVRPGSRLGGDLPAAHTN